MRYCFEVLDLSIDATVEEIKERYAQLIKEFNPNLHPEKFIEN